MIAAYLMDFFNQHLRDQVVPWLMVGSCVCIGLCDSINVLEDVLHGILTFLFLCDPSSDVAVPESLDES